MPSVTNDPSADPFPIDPVVGSILSSFCHAQRSLLIHFSIVLMQCDGASYSDAVSVVADAFDLSRPNAIHTSSAIEAFLCYLKGIDFEDVTHDLVTMKAALATLRPCG